VSSDDLSYPVAHDVNFVLLSLFYFIVIVVP